MLVHAIMLRCYQWQSWDSLWTVKRVFSSCSYNLAPALFIMFETVTTLSSQLFLSFVYKSCSYSVKCYYDELSLHRVHHVHVAFIQGNLWTLLIFYVFFFFIVEVVGIKIQQLCLISKLVIWFVQLAFLTRNECYITY